MQNNQKKIAGCGIKKCKVHAAYAVQSAVLHSMYSIFLYNNRYRTSLQTPTSNIIQQHKQNHRWTYRSSTQYKTHQQCKSRSELVPLLWNEWNKPSTGEWGGGGRKANVLLTWPRKGKSLPWERESCWEWGTDKPLFRKGDSYLGYTGNRETHAYGEVVNKSLKLH